MTCGLLGKTIVQSKMIQRNNTQGNDMWFENDAICK